MRFDDYMKNAKQSAIYVGLFHIGYYRSGDAILDVYTDGGRLYIDEDVGNLPKEVPLVFEETVLNNLIPLAKGDASANNRREG